MTTADTFRQAPHWAYEEPLIHKLLNRFIDKIDQQQTRLTVKVGNKTTPELFDYQHEDTGYLWGLVTALDNEYHILSIKKQRVRQGQEIYDDAILQFNADKEALVRHWLQRPAVDPYSIIWAGTLDTLASQFEDGGESLRQQILRKEGKSAEAILQGFAKINSELAHAVTLRSLSARCFQGDSKFLDTYEELVRQTYPLASRNIKQRPMLMLAFVPEGFSHVLFVENQDSFLELADFAALNKSLHNTAIVYSAGFHGSAARVRQPGAVRFFFLNTVKAKTRSGFESWWLAMAFANVECSFWGDLDYSGMGILAALRNSFTSMQAWQPGYRVMLDYHRQGTSHELPDAGKEKQRDPLATGCLYADQVLLPAMRQSGRFVDQEVVLMTELLQYLP